MDGCLRLRVWRDENERVVNNCVSGGCASEGVCIGGGFVLNVALLFSSSMSVVLAPLPIMHHHNSRTSTKKKMSELVRISSQRIRAINLVQTSSRLRYFSFIIVASSIKH